MEQFARPELVSDMEVRPDGFGGSFYLYKDRWGNKHITNNLNFIFRELGTSEVAESILPVDRNVQGVTIKKTLEISRLEKSKGALPDPSDPFEAGISEQTIADPLEPINRVFFQFNDKLYFWLLKPLSTGYRAITPQPVRVGVRNFFYNLAFPIRFVNCLLQAKIEGASNELGRFLLNSTAGIGGFFDVATRQLNMKRYEEDFGQTLGSYGMGPAFFINWPILGPSTLRDTFGLLGDAVLDPLNYLVPRSKYNLSVKAYDGVNETSLSIGDYEELKKAAFDPYIAVKDAYDQNRRSKIKE